MRDRTRASPRPRPGACQHAQGSRGLATCEARGPAPSSYPLGGGEKVTGWLSQPHRFPTRSPVVSKHRTRLHAGPAQTVGLGVGGPPPSWTQPVPRAPHCPLPAWPPQPLPAPRPRPRMLASRLELRGQRMRTSPTSPVRFAGGWGVLRRRRRVLNVPETFYCRWCPTARHAGERPPYPEFPRDTPTFPAPAPPRRA